MNDHQPPPLPTAEDTPVVLDGLLLDYGESDPVWDTALCAFMTERARAGRKKYGQFLQPDNGRDHLVDALQEAADMVFYLRAARMASRGLDRRAEMLLYMEQDAADLLADAYDAARGL